MKLAAAAVAAGVLALPPPSFWAPGYPLSLAAAGPRVAVGTARCLIRVAVPASRTRPVGVRTPPVCRGDDPAAVDGVWLGRSAIAATTIQAPSPHGESYGLWTGPLLRGPLRQVGDDWGWTDSDVPAGYGCAWSIASGGGVIALTQIPNRFAVEQGLADKPACPAGSTTKITLLGAAPPRLTLTGSWSILATDGKRLALARIDADGVQTGELAVVDLHGKRLPKPAIAPAVVKVAIDGWLTPEGLVLETAKTFVGPGWTVRAGGAGTVGYGRLLYVKGRTLRVRRIRGGADRPLLRVPSTEALVAAGSFGVAIAAGQDDTSVYRIPWRTIDRVLPR